MSFKVYLAPEGRQAPVNGAGSDTYSVTNGGALVVNTGTIRTVYPPTGWARVEDSNPT